MKHLSLIASALLPLLLAAQQHKTDTLAQFQSGRYALGGLTAYYFWEEDSLGKIQNGSFIKPYRRNEIIVMNATPDSDQNLNKDRVISAVSEMSHRNNDSEKRYFEAKPPIPEGSDKIYFPLRKRASDAIGSVLYRSRNGKWESLNRKNVVYLNIYADSSKSYSHSNDSVILLLHHVKRKAYGHYLIKTFWNEREEMILQQVFAYNGENVTDYFTQHIEEAPCRMLVFVNGYRGPKRNRDESDNLITRRDRYRYWMRLDKLFVHRLRPDDYFYLDGSRQIATSNHRSMANFSLSYTRIKALRKKERNANEFQLLNQTPNVEGFEQRRHEGEIAAQAYLAMRCNSPTCTEVRDTLDFVCHSMGYAYMLGFMDALGDRVVPGKCYIIAPENACSGGTDWSRFQEVWQYGSNLDQANPDPVWQQDGIAPQCQVKDLESAHIGGRVFLPAYIRKKDFINSHMLRQYHWIIKDLKPGEPGYAHPH